MHWDGREWSLGGEITPRDPVSFYHVSKVQDTFNVYEACKYWWLRSYDVMQGVIYGVHTDEVSRDPRLRTRLDIDEWFGTVVNRFVAQAIQDMPLTVYGGGEQIRGFIALEDAMECMCRLIVSPPEPGQYDVVNQVSGLHKISVLAETVARVAETYRLDIKIQRLENPRVEADRHPFEVVSTKLPHTFGFTPRVSLETEISRMFELLTKAEIKKRIEEKVHLILPKTRWDGFKRESDILEIYEHGIKEDTGFKPILDT
jgi:UDP-sulfoquinovose synthase